MPRTKRDRIKTELHYFDSKKGIEVEVEDSKMSKLKNVPPPPLSLSLCVFIFLCPSLFKVVPCQGGLSSRYTLSGRSLLKVYLVRAVSPQGSLCQGGLSSR